MTLSLATSDRADASLRRAAQLAALEQGLPVVESVRPMGQEAGVGPKKVASRRDVDILHPRASFERDLLPTVIVLSATMVNFADQHYLENICHAYISLL